jgi:hypothetical protein
MSTAGRLHDAISETLAEHNAYTRELSDALMDYVWLFLVHEGHRFKKPANYEESVEMMQNREFDAG